MDQPLLVTTDKRGVCTLTLNRPERHNAFDDQLITLLLRELEEIESDPSVRVVILTGTGKSFSSGADLEWMRGMAKYDEQTNRADARRVAELMERLNTLSKPTLAQVNGPAFAGAVGLIACCDVVIASERAEFAISEVRLGLVPAVISPYVIAAIGARQARRLFLTAERISSEEARRIGLVHEVASDDALANAVEKHVQYLLKAGPKALTECKSLVLRLTKRETAEDTSALIARLRVSEEGQEGMTAFFEKRKPKWAK